MQIDSESSGIDGFFAPQPAFYLWLKAIIWVDLYVLMNDCLPSLPTCANKLGGSFLFFN